MANPVPGYRVTTPFGKPGSWAAGFHTGADLAAPAGARVVAMRSGRVIHVGWHGWGNSYGVQVIIDHGGGIRAAYCHLSRTSVHVGQDVTEGTEIGRVGTTGNSTGPHLHVECRQSPFKYNNRVVNPVSYFGTSENRRAASGAPTHLSKLKFSQRDSESVKNLQRALNAHKMPGGTNLPITGYYGPMTDEEVRLCQRLHLPPEDPPKKSFVGPKQAAHLQLPRTRP